VLGFPSESATAFNPNGERNHSGTLIAFSLEE